MQTEKWPTTEQVGGATVLLPPGFHSTGNSSGLVDEKYFVSGRKKQIIVGAGDAPKSSRTTSTIERIPSDNSPGAPPNDGVTEMQISSCETTINGRLVGITFSSTTLQDRSASDASSSGTTYQIIARFYAAPPHREMFVAFQTDVRSEIESYRQIFWAVTFDGSVPPSSAPAKPLAPGAIASAPAPAPCTPKPDASLPTPDAVLDTALMQSILASAGPVPHGFALMSLKFDGTGALTNISVPQSDLPDAAQRQLATLVASNLKPHDKHTPSSYTLRVDAADTGLRYTVGGACGP